MFWLSEHVFSWFSIVWISFFEYFVILPEIAKKKIITSLIRISAAYLYSSQTGKPIFFVWQIIGCVVTVVMMWLLIFTLTVQSETF